MGETNAPGAIPDTNDSQHHLTHESGTEKLYNTVNLVYHKSPNTPKVR